MAEHGIMASPFNRARRPEKLVTLLLLFILLTAAAAGVTGVLIGPDWGSLWRALTLGLLAGWVLAIWKQPALRSGLISTALGAAHALLFSGGLRDRLFAVIIELVYIPGRVAASPRDPQIAFARLTQLLQELLNALDVVIERVSMWVTALVAGEPAFDPLAAAVVWSILIWLIAAWAGWMVEGQRSALLASLPALLLSLGTLSYGQRVSATLYVMLGSALLLLATVQFDHYRLGWEREAVAYPPRKGRQIGNSAMLLVVVLVALSAILSSISLPRIREWVSAQAGGAPQQEGRLAKSLGIMAGPTATPDSFEDVRRPGLPREQLIGSGPELSRRRVMTVEVNDYASNFEGRRSVPLYWRSFTYDLYTGHGWQTGSTTVSTYQSNEALRASQAPYHVLIRQTVRAAQGRLGVLFTAGEPVVVSQSSSAAWRSDNDLFGIQVVGTAGYTASSLLPAAGEDALRSAGQNYPDWVKRRFLSLPSEVPARVKDLAVQLTAAERTPYDRAKAIERYLRTISYTLDVPHPPADQDLVDYFLFDLRKGYCDYYASAMVVLARAAGIPARFVVGYASGTYDLNSQRFLVTEADAHSWVEAYFPGVGWVIFEPTAGRPALEPIEGLASGGTQETTVSDDFVDGANPRLTPDGWLILLGALGATGTLLFIWIAIDEFRLRRASEVEAAGVVYRRLRRYGLRLSAAPIPGETPYEFAASLGSRLREISFFGKTPLFAAHLSAQVYRLTDRIVRISYRPTFISVKGAGAVYAQWTNLRWRLYLMWLISRISTLYTRVVTLLVGDLRDELAGVKQEV